MNQCTEDFECLVIDNNAKSNKLEDQVFWYKAADRPDFKLGSKEFWELSKNLADDDGDEYDPNAKKKKSGNNVIVKKTNGKW
jgi:hypothetical protein